MWALQPPTVDDWRAAVAAAIVAMAPPIIYRRAANAMLVCLVILLHFSMIKKRGHQNFEDRTKILRESLKTNVWPSAPRRPAAEFLGPTVLRRRPKLTSAPPTQRRRRRALTTTVAYAQGLWRRALLGL